jgi:hypothetical protein
MKVSILGRELEFKENLYSNEKTGEWFTEFPILNKKISFEFHEKIFKSYNSSIITIDWAVISEVINYVLSHYNALLKKSQPLLLALNQALFEKEKLYPEGFFELVGFRLNRVSHGNCEILLCFEFLTFDSDPIDPYYFWLVRFNKGRGLNTVIGVERREVNDPGI